MQTQNLQQKCFIDNNILKSCCSQLPSGVELIIDGMEDRDDGFVVVGTVTRELELSTKAITKPSGSELTKDIPEDSDVSSEGYVKHVALGDDVSQDEVMHSVTWSRMLLEESKVADASILYTVSPKK